MITELIKFTETKNSIDYCLTIRNNFYLENDPNYDRIITNGLPMDFVCKELSEGQVVKLISYAITRCIRNFNVSKNMSDEQVVNLAMDWTKSYSVKGSIDEPTFRIEEILTFLELAMFGKYGQPFDRIDAGILQEWIEVYWSQRREKCFEIFDQKRIEPTERTINENDRLNRAVLTLAGRLGTAKNKTG